jgi:hypothetical protein
VSNRPHPKYASSDVHAGPWATCDDCGFIWNLPRFQNQREWGGFSLINKFTLVCPKCLDVPNEQLRTLILPPDPDPVIFARPEQYSVDEGLMPLTTEPGGNPGPVEATGSVLRDSNGNYIGVEP